MSLFISQVRLDRIKDPELRVELLKEIKQASRNQAAFSSLELDKFLAISDWYHFALLDLTEIKGFTADFAWIANRLGISKYEAEIAVDRLIRLGLLEKTSANNLKKTKNCRIESIPSSAIRKFHCQMIKKALKSIEEQKFEQRDISGTTFSVDPSKLDEAKKRIREFREEMNEFFSTGKKQNIYQLNIQLFQLDQPTRESL